MMQNADPASREALSAAAPGLAEAPAPFRHDAPDAGRPLPAKIGVRLSRAGTPALVIPDVAALPRALRDRRLKRALDLVLALALLAILAAPMMAIALCLVPGGGALFVQSRVGRGRRRFACLKFRTMRPGAEARLERLLLADPQAAREWHRHQKLARDPRTTPLGRLLRRSSLDELPQLLNVLRGEMSLVGPRPVIAPEVAGYPGDRDYYADASFDDYAGCLPGLTGLWQISGRHATAHESRITLDRIYARNWSVLLDLRILWRTLGVVLSGSGR